MVAWRWVIGPWGTGPERELTLANSRQMTATLTAPATASFSIPGRADEAALLSEMETDLWVYADANLVFRGRVVQLADTVTADVHTLACDVVDYRGLLSRRLLVEGDQLAWSTPNLAAIAWGLVNLTQQKTGGYLGIVQGTWTADSPASPPSVRNYQAGQQIGQALDDLAGVAFDYQIDPALRMNLWAPSYRPVSAFVGDYGGTVLGFTRSATHSTWANVIRESGDASQTVGVNLSTVAQEGRFEQQIGNPDVVLQTTVAQRAAADQQKWLARRASLNMDLRPGVVHSFADLACGSQIQVALRSGRLNVTGTYTVQQVKISLDDTGVTHTNVGLLSE